VNESAVTKLSSVPGTGPEQRGIEIAV